MPYANGRRVAIQPEAQPQLQHAPFAAPTGGWVSAVNLAAATPGTARVCENWFPTTTGLRLRAGSRVYATLGEDTATESAFAYIGGTVRQLFAANGGNIYNVTTPASPTDIPTPVVTGRTSNYYTAVNFATLGGNFLTLVNGTDPLLLFNGTEWEPIDDSSTPAITGMDTDRLSHVNVYRNRQWFVEKDTLNLHYLPVDSIAGALSTLTLAGVFKRGGAILLTATWSMDAGDGLDDKFVVVSTEGEVAVFQGSDPSDPNWSIVGRYDASPPMGKNAFTQVGGDLLILMEIGIVPMSAIISKSPDALALAAVSRSIQPDWIRDSQERRALPWEVVKWTSRNIAFISCPTTDPNKRWCYVVNLETNAWAKYTGWDTRCLVLHEDQVYFGSNAGTLLQAEVTGTDEGAPIYHTYVGHAEHLGSVGRYKTVQQARCQFRVTYPIAAQVSVSTNYNSHLPAPPNVAPITVAADVWDGAVWDVAKWDNAADLTTQTTRWVSIGASGEAHSLQVQVTSGQNATPTAEMIMVEVTYNAGGVVV